MKQRTSRAIVSAPLCQYGEALSYSRLANCAPVKITSQRASRNHKSAASCLCEKAH